MRAIPLALLVLTAGAAPPKPVTLNVGTAGDLADACAAKPTNPTNLAMLNFCYGFAQGVVQTHQNAEGTSIICFPKPPPKRSATMQEFVRWVGADAERRKQVASSALIGFMSSRFPCKSNT
jgi:hypothetical protein